MSNEARYSFWASKRKNTTSSVTSYGGVKHCWFWQWLSYGWVRHISPQMGVLLCDICLTDKTNYKTAYWRITDRLKPMSAQFTTKPIIIATKHVIVVTWKSKHVRQTNYLCESVCQWVLVIHCGVSRAGSNPILADFLFYYYFIFISIISADCLVLCVVVLLAKPHTRYIHSRCFL